MHVCSVAKSGSKTMSIKVCTMPVHDLHIVFTCSVLRVAGII